MAIKELSKGLELITELWLSIDDQSEAVTELCGRIMKSLENSLAFLKPADANVSSQDSCSQMIIQKPSDKGMKRLLYDQNIKEQGKRCLSRRRMNLKKIITNSPFGDCYQWRKYGQKMIRNAEHPRCYYICASGGCSAKRRVQQVSNKRPVPDYEVTFEGGHTCSSQFKPMPSPARDLRILNLERSTSIQEIGCRREYVFSTPAFGAQGGVTANGLEGPAGWTAPTSPPGQFYGADASSYGGLEFEAFMAPK